MADITKKTLSYFYHGEDRRRRVVDAVVATDHDQIKIMVIRALKNKSGKCTSGPITVKVKK